MLIAQTVCGSGHCGSSIKVIRFFTRPSALTKSPMLTDHGIILIADVVSGTPKKGHKITIRTEKGSITDTIVRMECKSKEIEVAKAGMSIGLCLAKSSEAQLVALTN